MRDTVPTPPARYRGGNGVEAAGRKQAVHQRRRRRAAAGVVTDRGVATMRRAGGMHRSARGPFDHDGHVAKMVQLSSRLLPS